MSTNSINFQLSGTIVGFSGESIPPLNTYIFKWAKLKKLLGWKAKHFMSGSLCIVVESISLLGSPGHVLLIRVKQCSMLVISPQHNAVGQELANFPVKGQVVYSRL